MKKRSVTSSVCGPICGPVVGAVTERVSTPALSAFSAAKYAIAQDAADVNILVIGDSTGDATDEWVYLFAQWIATEHATHSVSYRLWDDTNNVYLAETSISTGSGSNTIRFWNASVAGKGQLYLTGSKQSAMTVDADLILFSHGKNSQDGLTTPQRRMENLMGWDMARSLNADAGLAVVLQCPNRDDTSMTDVVAQQTIISAIYGDCGLLDVHSAFLALNKDASLYKDAIHPSPAGSAVWAGVIERKWSVSPAIARTIIGALVSTKVANLLANGDFSDWASTLPTSWSATASPTVAKELSIVDGSHPYSLKLTGTTLGARIQNFLTTAARNSVKGKNVTLAVRAYIPEGSASSVGRVAVLVDSPTAPVTSTSAAYIEGEGGFHWIFVQSVAVPTDASNVRVILYCNTSANTDSASYFDRAILVAGDIPRDMS